MLRKLKHDKRTTSKSNSKYELGDRSSIPARGIFFSSQLYLDRLHSSLDPVLSSYQGVLPTRVKRPDHETNSPRSSAQANIRTATPLFHHTLHRVMLNYAPGLSYIMSSQKQRNCITSCLITELHIL